MDILTKPKAKNTSYLTVDTAPILLYKSRHARPNASPVMIGFQTTYSGIEEKKRALTVYIAQIYKTDGLATFEVPMCPTLG